jgi:thiol-disulfide isomerase/thioredoxin
MINVKGSADTPAARAMQKALGGGPNGGCSDDLARVMMGMPSLQKKKQQKERHDPRNEPIIRSTRPARGTEDDDGDESSDLSGLDDDEGDLALETIRRNRLEQLKGADAKTQSFRRLGHGEYREIAEDEFLKEVTESKFCVVHFYHSDFARCKIVDKHLADLAPRHLPTKFVKMNAGKSPFFVEKLAIRVMPTIVLFADGVAVDRIVGFEELGAKDDFGTIVLEKRIAMSGICMPPKGGKRRPVKKNNIRAGKHTTLDGGYGADSSHLNQLSDEEEGEE